MIQVIIAEETRDLRDVDSRWLRSSIEKLRHSSAPVCVKVAMKFGEVDMVLATPGCPAAGAPKEQLDAGEMRLLDLWRRKGLNRDNFAIHELEEFLKQLQSRL